MHIGRNIEKIRELKGMKQETLAIKVGLSQQTISRIEQSEMVEEEKLETIATALGVSAEAIKKFSDDSVIFNIENMHDNSSANYQYHFNPIDKVIELYERIIKEKDEVIEIYKKQLQVP